MKALILVAEAWAAAGQPQRAEQVARRLRNSDRQPEALMRLAEALAAAGQLERAQRVARSLGDLDRQVETLMRVAEALAATQPERAKQLALEVERYARSFTYEPHRAETLSRVAAVLARRNENSARDGSVRIVAEILGSDSWYYAMPVLASLDPAAAASTGTALLAWDMKDPLKW